MVEFLTIDRNSPAHGLEGHFRVRRTDWLQSHPGSGAIALVVEAADSSVEEDRALAPTYLVPCRG